MKSMIGLVFFLILPFTKTAYGKTYTSTNSVDKCLIGDVELDRVNGKCSYRDHRGHCNPGEFECGPIFNKACVSTQNSSISQNCYDKSGSQMLQNNRLVTPSREYYEGIKEGVQARYKKYCTGKQIKYVDACRAYTGVLNKNPVLAIGVTKNGYADASEAGPIAPKPLAPPSLISKNPVDANISTQAVGADPVKEKVKKDFEDILDLKKGFVENVGCPLNIAQFNNSLAAALNESTVVPSFRSDYLESLDIWKKYEDLKQRCQIQHKQTFPGSSAVTSSNRCKEILGGLTASASGADDLMESDFEMYMSPTSTGSALGVSRAIAQDVSVYGDLLSLQLHLAAKNSQRVARPLLAEESDVDTLIANRKYHLTDGGYLAQLKQAYLQDDSYKSLPQGTKPVGPLHKLISNRVQGPGSPYLKTLAASESGLKKFLNSLEKSVNSQSRFESEMAKEMKSLVEASVKVTATMQKNFQTSGGSVGSILKKLEDVSGECLSSSEFLEGLTTFYKNSMNEFSSGKPPSYSQPAQQGGQ